MFPCSANSKDRAGPPSMTMVSSVVMATHTPVFAQPQQAVYPQPQVTYAVGPVMQQQQFQPQSPQPQHHQQQHPPVVPARQQQQQQQQTSRGPEQLPRLPAKPQSQLKPQLPPRPTAALHHQQSIQSTSYPNVHEGQLHYQNPPPYTPDYRSNKFGDYAI